MDNYTRIEENHSGKHQPGRINVRQNSYITQQQYQKILSLLSQTDNETGKRFLDYMMTYEKICESIEEINIILSNTIMRGNFMHIDDKSTGIRMLKGFKAKKDGKYILLDENKNILLENIQINFNHIYIYEDYIIVRENHTSPYHVFDIHGNNTLSENGVRIDNGIIVNFHNNDCTGCKDIDGNTIIPVKKQKIRYLGGVLRTSELTNGRKIYEGYMLNGEKISLLYGEINSLYIAEFRNKNNTGKSFRKIILGNPQEGLIIFDSEDMISTEILPYSEDTDLVLKELEEKYQFHDISLKSF